MKKSHEGQGRAGNAAAERQQQAGLDPANMLAAAVCIALVQKHGEQGSEHGPRSESKKGSSMAAGIEAMLHKTRHQSVCCLNKDVHNED